MKIQCPKYNVPFIYKIHARFQRLSVKKFFDKF